jgi:probable F420-dependent oxidoreductase
MGVAGDVDAMVRIVRAADAAGLESVWTAEHTVLPDPQAPPSPSHPRTPFLDPLVALGHVAANTTRVRLGTGIVILPQRNPVTLAKELATVDVLSKGRLIFGLGSGYLEPEFRAVGAPFEERGVYTDEAIEAILALWTMEKPSHRGRFFSFAGVDAWPRPRQRPHPPIVVGGRSRNAARRVARYGDGFYGFFSTIDEVRRMMRWIDEYSRAGFRPPHLGRPEISVTPPSPPTRELVERYAEIGVDRLIPWPMSDDFDATLRFVDTLADLAR